MSFLAVTFGHAMSLEQRLAVRRAMVRGDGVCWRSQLHSLAPVAERDPDAADGENPTQPPSSRVPGPTGFYSTALWPRAAFAGLHYDIRHTAAHGTLVAVNSTMTGCHVAPWAVYTGDGAIDTVFPPTGKTFAMTQSHWFRIEDSQIIEHWANRDDLGMARQLGWIPPTPVYLFKMARAKRRAQRR